VAGQDFEQKLAPGQVDGNFCLHRPYDANLTDSLRRRQGQNVDLARQVRCGPVVVEEPPQPRPLTAVIGIDFNEKEIEDEKRAE